VGTICYDSRKVNKYFYFMALHWPISTLEIFNQLKLQELNFRNLQKYRFLTVFFSQSRKDGLGSLWPVSDTATQQLLSEFYLNLKDAKVSKAEALRQAQIKLIKRDNFEHPFYWSAFILVGNWL